MSDSSNAKADRPKEDPSSAKLKAQRLAFAPILFQAARILRDRGILYLLLRRRRHGMTIEDLVEASEFDNYGVRVLVEGGLAAELIERREERYYLTQVGYFMLRDELTRVNTDFVNDVCYEAMSELETSLDEKRPAGLGVFGDWTTIYEGLSQLPDKAQKSWFDFDHLYSDSAFPLALPHVFKTKPKHLYDIGGNTGKFTLCALRHDPDVHVTILDLPGQLTKATANIHAAGLAERYTPHPIDLLDPECSYPPGADAVWMSQFLSCFSEEQVVALIRRGAEALVPGGAVYILDTYWDMQEHEESSLCLQASSLYFTCLANGNSRMYRYTDMHRMVKEAGLKVEEEVKHLGISHTLFRCVPQ